VTRPSDPAPASALEIAVAVHLAAFVIGVSWAFGGNADWVRTPISIWGSLGIVLTVAVLAWARPAGPVRREALGWAWPVLALNALVAVSCLTPGMTALQFRDQTLFIPARVAWWIPSTTRPDLALRALWLFDGIYCSCLNLALVASRRRTIRFVLAAVAANAVALAVFGTVQKLVGAPGLYFGAVPTPQPAFFASFVYDNHWGAFALLSLGALAGLTLRSLGRRGAGFFRGPAFGGWVAAVLIGLSIPLSGSRACTLLLALMATLAAVQGLPRMAHALRLSAGGPRTTLALAAAVAALSIAGAWMIAGDAIQARTAKTREQLGAMWAAGGLGSRTVLYRDTWRMAEARPLFGWGMASYPVVFGLYNTQESKVDRLPVIYHDAHSDWLQSLAELGFAGTVLLGAAVVRPALALRGLEATTVPVFLLAGCLLVAAYAWIEFPFGNVAVVLAWWLCFFAAIQYVRLTGLPRSGRPAGP
jgi:O-antigen ligase